MAIVFVEKRKKQRYLIFVFILVIILTIITLWKGLGGSFSSSKFYLPALSLPPSSGSFNFSPVRVNWEVLKNPLLKEMTSPSLIPPFEGTPGRENPFVPF